MSTVRTSIDGWLERFFRRRASLANPTSTMGPQLERIKRQSTNRDGRKFVKQRTRPVYDAVDCRYCTGVGCDRCSEGKVAVKIGDHLIDYVVCKDDSPAHNAAHRTDEMYADHGADLMVWASLTDDERRALELQRQPISCTGRWQRPRRQRPVERNVCDHGSIQRLGGNIGQCRDCAGMFEIDDKNQPLALLVCRDCGMQERVNEGTDGNWYVGEHVRRVRLRVERRLADRRDGDGTELVMPLSVGADGYCAMFVYEPVKRYNDDIAAEMNMSERQLRRVISSARHKIELRLRDESPPTIVEPRGQFAQTVTTLIRWLDAARAEVSFAILDTARRWGVAEYDADGAVVGVRRINGAE